MLQLNIIPEQRKAVILYPKDARKPSKTISVYSADHAQKKWEMETREYIYQTLRKWVIQRNYAYKMAGELSSQRAYAVDRLLLMLINCQTTTLKVMCTKVVERYEDFHSLFPPKDSSCISWTKQVVAPILLWCQEYRDLMREASH